MKYWWPRHYVTAYEWVWFNYHFRFVHLWGGHWKWKIWQRLSWRHLGDEFIEETIKFDKKNPDYEGRRLDSGDYPR